MSRKSLIFALAVLLAIFLALGVAIAFLYSDTSAGWSDKKISLGDECSCLCAVPSDAVLVLCSSDAGRTCGGVLSSFEIPDSLSSSVKAGTLTSLRKCPMSVSLHYSGKLIPLFVFNVGSLSDLAEGMLKERLADLGCFVERNDDYLIASGSETLVRSSSRHLDSGVSIVDANGFAEAMEAADGNEQLFIPGLHVRRLLDAAGGKAFAEYSSFIAHIADWGAFTVGKDEDCLFSLNGAFVMDGDADEYLASLADCTPSVSEVAEVLPSYTVSFVSFPLTDTETYASAYKAFKDSRQQLHTMTSRQKELARKVGVSPEEFFGALKVKELASASFVVDGKMESVNLMRIGNKDASLIFRGTGIDTFRGYRPSVHSWAYPSFMASMFGDIFALDDESCFTFADGWVISGSRNAIEEYVERNALDYTLNQYLSDAGRADLLSQIPSVLLAYHSLKEGKTVSVLKPSARRMIDAALDSDCAPVVLRITGDKDKMAASAGLYSLTLRKTKAPEFERDTVVVVPAGPFKVKNSHTGKINTFYQNSSMAICLRDENGKDLWGVPFGKSICGCAHNVDYFANGKLQIAFGAGSSIYVIDRLGRYVGGFPVDLGKEILVGPDIYDFSGSRRYNAMVLHKDNTIDMYNLKGRKPEQWKGITAEETIKGLPQRLTLSGKDFWIVRTSIQTLIFPFYGGSPLTVFEGDEKIRPDAEIKIADASTVRFNCYDGKERTLKLK